MNSNVQYTYIILFKNLKKTSITGIALKDKLHPHNKSHILLTYNIYFENFIEQASLLNGHLLPNMPKYEEIYPKI